jgi:quercetin dioxygenase-like cupin family protein
VAASRKMTNVLTDVFDLRAIPSRQAPPFRLRRWFRKRRCRTRRTGRVAKGDGCFVLNAKNARWYHAEGRPALCNLEGETFLPQFGINIVVLGPGQPIAMYHWQADQEDFLVLSGEALLIVEGEERQLKQWDFVHCPPHTKHVIVGASDGRCVVVAVGYPQVSRVTQGSGRRGRGKSEGGVL